MKNTAHNRKFIRLLCGTAIASLCLTSLTQASTLGYWRFEGDGASYLADSSGNGNNLSSGSWTTAPGTSLPSGFWTDVDVPGSGSVTNTQAAAMTQASTRFFIQDKPEFSTNAMTIEALVNVTDSTRTTSIFGQSNLNTSRPDLGGFGFNIAPYSATGGTHGSQALYFAWSDGEAWKYASTRIGLSLNTSYYVAVAVDVSIGSAVFYIKDLSIADSVLNSYVVAFSPSLRLLHC